MSWIWLKDFADAVRDRRSPLVSIGDMVAAVRAADMFYRAAGGRKRELQK
jgi:hypothetical protein